MRNHLSNTSAICVLALVMASGAGRSASGSAADQQDVIGALSKLPGFASLILNAVNPTAEPRVFTVETGSNRFSATAFQTEAGPDKPWHAALRLNDPSRFTFRPVYRFLADEVIGQARPTDVLLISARAKGEALLTGFPQGLRETLRPFANDKGVVALGEGCNVFMPVELAKDGVVGMLNERLHLDGKRVLLSGVVGPGAIEMVLREAGVLKKDAAAEKPKDARLALAVAFPELTPRPFAQINNRDIMHMVYRTTRFTIETTLAQDQEQTSDYTISGAQEIDLWLNRTKVSFTRTLRVAREGQAHQVTADGSAALNWRNALGVDGLTIRDVSVGLDAASTEEQNSDGTVTVTLDVNVEMPGHGRLAGRLGMTARGREVTDLALTLAAASPRDGINLGRLPAFSRLEGLDTLRLNSITLGMNPETRDLHATGQATWQTRGITAEISVVRHAISGNRQALILFMQADGINLRRLVPRLPQQAEMIGLDHGMLAISSEDFRDLDAKRLPAAVQAMVRKVTGGLDGRVPVFRGVTLLTRFDPATASRELKDAFGRLGMTQPIVLAGSVGGVFSGQPAVALYADLPTLPTPTIDRNPLPLKVRGAGARLFLVLQAAGGGTLQLGIDGTVGMKVGDDELEFGGSTYVVLSAISQGVRIAGRMNGTWDKPFRLEGIAFSDVAISGGVDADSSVEVAITGRAKYGRFSYGMGGIVSLVAASGGLVPKKIGLMFEGSEISALTQVQIMGALARAAAAGPIAHAIPPGPAQTTLRQLAGRDLASTIEQTIPLPYMKVTNFRLYLVSPGVTFPDCDDINGMGVAVRGTLNFMNRTMGSTNSSLTIADGFRVHAKPGNFDLGLVKLNNAVFDVLAPIPGAPGGEKAHVILRGTAAAGCSAVTGAVDVEFSRERAAFAFKTSLAGYAVDVGASADLSKFPSFLLDGRFDPQLARDVATAIAGRARDRVTDATATAKGKIDAAKAEFDQARAAADSAVAKARSEARAEVQARLDDIRAFLKKKEDESSNPVIRKAWETAHDRARSIRLGNDNVIPGIDDLREKVDAVSEALKKISAAARGTIATAVNEAVRSAKSKIDGAKAAAKGIEDRVKSNTLVQQAGQKRQEAENAFNSARETVTAATLDPIADAISNAKDMLVIEHVGFDSGLDAICSGRLPMLNVTGSFAGRPFAIEKGLQLARRDQLAAANRKNIDAMLDRLRTAAGTATGTTRGSRP